MYFPGVTLPMENFPSIFELTPVTNVLSGFNNTTEAEYTGSLVSSSITVPLTVTFCAHKHVPNKHIMKINRHLFFLMVFIYIRLLFL